MIGEYWNSSVEISYEMILMNYSSVWHEDCNYYDVYSLWTLQSESLSDDWSTTSDVKEIKIDLEKSKNRANIFGKTTYTRSSCSIKISVSEHVYDSPVKKNEQLICLSRCLLAVRVERLLYRMLVFFPLRLI